METSVKEPLCGSAPMFGSPIPSVKILTVVPSSMVKGVLFENSDLERISPKSWSFRLEKAFSFLFSEPSDGSLPLPPSQVLPRFFRGTRVTYPLFFPLPSLMACMYFYKLFVLGISFSL